MAIIEAANPLHTATVNTDDLWWVGDVWNEHTATWIARNFPYSGSFGAHDYLAEYVRNMAPYNLPDLTPSAEWIASFYQALGTKDASKGRSWSHIPKGSDPLGCLEALFGRGGRVGYYGMARAPHSMVAASTLIQTVEFETLSSAFETVALAWNVVRLKVLLRKSDASWKRWRERAQDTGKAWANLAKNPAMAHLTTAGDPNGATGLEVLVKDASALWAVSSREVSPSVHSRETAKVARGIFYAVATNPAAPMSVLKQVADILVPVVKSVAKNPEGNSAQFHQPWQGSMSHILATLGRIYLHPNWTGEVAYWEEHTNPLLRNGVNRLTTAAPHPTLFIPGAVEAQDSPATPKVMRDSENLVRDLLFGGTQKAEEWQEYVPAWPGNAKTKAFPNPFVAGAGISHVTGMNNGDIPPEWINEILY